MKKIIILITLPILLSVVSCESFIEGWDDSPNSPTEATPQLLTSVSEVSTFMYYTGQLARTPSVFIQQTAGTDFHMEDVRDYILLEGDNVNEWEGIYSNCLINEQLIIDTYGDDNPYYAGIAKVLKAMALGLLTDLWGDVPNREALQAVNGVSDEQLNPHFDPQETVIQDIQSILSDAISDLSKPASDNILPPGVDDYIFEGDPDAWINTAWILKARYANRLSKKDANGSATSALEFLAKVDKDQPDCMAIAGDAANEQNQWFDFQNDRGNYMQMGEFFIDLLKATNDPRLPFYALEDDNGEYSGSPKDESNTSTSDWGDFVGTESGTDLPLVTYFEAKFIEAEANLRLGNDDEAADALNEAVKTSVLFVTGASDAAYEAANASETGATVTLDKIMTQKYVAMFTQPEAWADWRRTSIPALTPNPNGDVAGIPRRFPTCRSERTYNNNAVVVSNILQPVWWDN